MTGNGGGILRFYLPRWEWFRTCSIPPSFNRERNLKFKVIELFSFPWKNRWNREEKPNPSFPIVPHRNGKQKKKKEREELRIILIVKKFLGRNFFQLPPFNRSTRTSLLKKKRKKRSSPWKAPFSISNRISTKKKKYIPFSLCLLDAVTNVYSHSYRRVTLSL